MSAGQELTYRVPRISCSSCRMLVTEELEEVPGVESVDVDVDAKRVVVRGTSLDDAAIRTTLSDVGYDAAPAGAQP